MKSYAVPTPQSGDYLASMAESGSFYIGCELELLVRSKKRHTEWMALAQEISKRLRQAGIANHIPNDKSRPDYTKWSIVQEITIPQPDKHTFGVELVSRTYSARDARWPAELATVFKALQHGSLALAAAAAAAAAACCSTHVHVSRAPPLAPAELAALAKAALLYEPALDRLVPPHRRGGRAGRDGNDDGDGDGGCYWIRSNRASTALRRLRLGECLGRIDAAAAAAAGGEGGQGTGTHGTLSAVVEVMNLFPADSPAGRAVRAPADFVHGKVFKWNFAGVAGRLGTVEFRQPPGSLGGDDAVGWVALAAAFVAGALALGPGLGGDSCSAREQGASLAELRALLRLGADALGWPGLGVVDAWLERAEREAET